MHPLIATAHQERGSIPLALLAVIVVAGLSAALVATVIGGQRATRFDQDYTEVLHSADAGLQDAVVRLNAGNLPPAFVNDVDGRSYDVTTTQPAPNRWEITSTSQQDGVNRTVVAEASEVPLFFFAVYARHGLAFNGANTVDSYSVADSLWCTGNGMVGTDGALDFSGLAPNGSCHKDGVPATETGKTTVDAALLYECGDLDAAACAATTVDGDVRCTHTGGENCNIPPLEAREEPFSITPEEEVQQILDETEECADLGWADTFLGISSSTGGVWVTDDGDDLTPRDPADGRDFYCVKSLLFAGDTTVTPGAGGEPVRIHVKGDPVDANTSASIMVEGSGTTVNCPGCTSNDYRATLPAASKLEIISVGTAAFELDDPQIMFAGAVYVPNAACSGPAGADVYGALVCGDVDNVGNWNFHYDDSLRDAGGTDVFALDRYREE
ncbi:MAG: DUF7305 domain-containing protein [Egibacteraceae bacterium]